MVVVLSNLNVRRLLCLKITDIPVIRRLCHAFEDAMCDQAIASCGAPSWHCETDIACAATSDSLPPASLYARQSVISARAPTAPDRSTHDRHRTNRDTRPSCTPADCTFLDGLCLFQSTRRSIVPMRAASRGTGQPHKACSGIPQKRKKLVLPR